MSRLTKRALEHEIRDAAPEPPPELLATLLREAPEELPAGLAPAARRGRPATRGLRTAWPLAASLVTVLAGGILAWSVVHRAPPLPGEPEARPAARGAGDAAAAPRTSAAASAPDAPDRSAAPHAAVAALPSPERPSAHPGGAPATPGPTAAARSGAASPPGAASPVGAVGSRAPAAAGTSEPTAPSEPRTPAPVTSLLVAVTDPTGVALPGATVTLLGRGGPAVRVTDEQGRASFPAVAAGNHQVAATLEGFATVELDVATPPGRSVRLAIGLPAAVEDVVTVTAESPQPHRSASVGASVAVAESVPAARDPWATLQRTRGVLTDRINVGGNEGGQRSARGGAAPPSTGGTAEPNDQPYGDVFFRGYGVNPFVDTEDDALSTFGLDVDSGSYNVARRYLGDGHLPPPEAVRLEELVNAFDYGDPAPRRGDFALRAEGAPSPWAPGERYYLLRLAVKAREVAARDRRPADLVFVVDVSGSMAREDRLGLVQQSLRLLLDELTPADRVALVVYGSRGEVRLPFTTDRRAIGAAIERLVPDGSTNAEEGLVLAYELAAQEGREEAVRRIVLCSDGVANVGDTGPESLLARIGTAARAGIELTTVGFGMGNYNDVLMEQLANRGNGRYAYVDTLAEARRIFVENLTGTLQTVAAEARAQVAFDPDSVARWRLLGYENRDIADERFRDDTVDAGEIGAGHAVTAVYEVKLQPGVERDRGARLGTLHLRWRPVAGDEHVETELDFRVADLAPAWRAGSRAFRLATVVARFAEVLRGSYWARGADLAALAEEARRLAAERADERVAELAALVARAAELRAAAAAPEGERDEP